VKYKLFFHTFNKEIEATIKVDLGLSYFDGERNRKVYQQVDAVDYVKSTHKHGGIEKLFKVPQDIYDSEYGDVGATTLKILRCWIG
jgi:fructose-bisphosphate aldolase class 1